MADLVGFTALAESADPEQVKNLLDRCFERLVSNITAFGGELDKIVGDQIVARFGAPIAHEDDAERAVRAALQMRHTVEDLGRELGTPIALRIGINTGEVFVGAMRAGGLSTVMGDVVNVASRLQTSAGPGQIVVGPATHEASDASVAYESLGPLTVKGRDEPVDAWIALEATAPPGHRREARKVPLVGRDSELAELQHALHIAISRRRAHLVLLIGEAGVGKTRLASELASEAQSEHGARVLTGQCAPYGDSGPWAPIAEMIYQAVGAEAGGATGTMRARILSAVADALGGEVDDGEVIRTAEGLLYITENLTRPGVDPTRARDDALRAVIACLEGFADEAPLVIVFSDLHWADDQVLEALNRLLARLWNLPIVLVATARPGFEDRWQPAAGRYNTFLLHLDPLDAEATSELVAMLLGQPVDDSVASFLGERSGGNPFFLEELVALISESADSANATLQPDRIRGLPATIHGLVAARLDALPASDRSLLEDFAVVGTNGPVGAALALGGDSESRAALARLADRDLLVLDGDDYRFKSALIRDVAYGTLPKAERARRHAMLSPLLATQDGRSTEQVARHLAIAAELVNELGPVDGVPADIRDQALEALSRAAQNAEHSERWLPAGRLHDRALSLIANDDADPRRLPSLLGRARALNAQRDLDRARADVQTALSEARASGATHLEAEALLLLGGIHRNAGEYEEAKRTYARAESLFRDLDDASGVASTQRDLGFTHLFCGENDEAEVVLSEALTSFQILGDDRGIAWALQNLAWIAFMRGRIPEADARLHEAADRFAEAGDWGGLGWAFGLLAFVRYHQGRLDEAEELAAQIAEEVREMGNPWAGGMMEALRADVALWRGHGEEAVRRGREALTLFEGIGDTFGKVQACGVVTRGLAGLGRWAEYEAALSDLADSAAEHPDPNQRYLAHVVSALVAVQKGDAELALAEATAARDHSTAADSLGDSEQSGAMGGALLQNGRVGEAVAILDGAFREADADGPRASLGGMLALALAAARRTDDAMALIATLDTIQGGTYMDRVLAHWVRGFVCVQRGDAIGAVDAFESACAIVDATDLQVDIAIAALARGSALQALGSDDAPAVLAQAADLLQALGIDAVGWETAFTLACGQAPPGIHRDRVEPVSG